MAPFRHCRKVGHCSLPRPAKASAGAPSAELRARPSLLPSGSLALWLPAPVQTCQAGLAHIALTDGPPGCTSSSLELTGLSRLAEHARQQCPLYGLTDIGWDSGLHWQLFRQPLSSTTGCWVSDAAGATRKVDKQQQQQQQHSKHQPGPTSSLMSAPAVTRMPPPRAHHMCSRHRLGHHEPCILFSGHPCLLGPVRDMVGLGSLHKAGLPVLAAAR